METDRNTLYHEAAHAVLAYLYVPHNQIQSVSVNDDDSGLLDAGVMNINRDLAIYITLAGPIIEHYLFDLPLTAVSNYGDYIILRLLICTDNKRRIDINKYIDPQFPDFDMIHTYYSKIKKILKREYGAIKILAQCLKTRKYISGVELCLLLNQHYERQKTLNCQFNNLTI